MVKRIIFNFVLLAAIFYTPWWIATPLAFCGAFLFNPYYEVIALGVVIDLLYGTSASALHGTAGIVGAVGLFFLGTIAASVIRPGYSFRC